MIAHVDADAFFASVLARKDPNLKGKPLIALGMGGAGIVIAATYEAKAYGVRTGMRLRDALALCPHALRMPSDFRETGIASAQIAAILGEQCPAVEPMSVDEWFLDLRTLPGGEPQDLRTWACTLQREILRRTALSVSIGIGSSKILAKMAGEAKKPAGVTVVENISAFLRSRPAAAIPGIGFRRQITAKAHGWNTAWDIAAADPAVLLRLFGRPGIALQQELLGTCLSPVQTEEDPPQSISRARSFPVTQDRPFLWAHLLQHLAVTVLKMRREQLACRGITVWLRDAHYESQGMQQKLPQLLQTAEEIQPYAARCFAELSASGGKCTQTGLVLWGLSPAAPSQYSLFAAPQDSHQSEQVQRALDALHERFGRNTVVRAAALPSFSPEQVPMVRNWGGHATALRFFEASA